MCWCLSIIEQVTLFYRVKFPNFLQMLNTCFWT